MGLWLEQLIEAFLGAKCAWSIRKKARVRTKWWRSVVACWEGGYGDVSIVAFFGTVSGRAVLW